MYTKRATKRNIICLLLVIILLFSMSLLGNAQDSTISVKDKKALMLVPISGESGHSFDDIEKSLRDQGGYQVRKITGSEVKPEDFKELHNYAVNFINTHGDYWNDSSGEQWCRLTTFKYFTPSYYRDNYDDFRNGRLIRNWRGVAHEKPFVAVTQRYISEYNQSYPNSLLYAQSCNQMTNQALSGALSKPGFMALIGFSRYSYMRYKLAQLAGGPLTSDEQSAIYFFSTAAVTNKPVRDAYNETKDKTAAGLQLKEYYGSDQQFCLNVQEGSLPEIPDINEPELPPWPDHWRSPEDQVVYEQGHDTWAPAWALEISPGSISKTGSCVMTATFQHGEPQGGDEQWFLVSTPSGKKYGTMVGKVTGSLIDMNLQYTCPVSARFPNDFIGASTSEPGEYHAWFICVEGGARGGTLQSGQGHGGNYNGRFHVE